MSLEIPAGVASSFQPSVQIRGTFLHSGRAVTRFVATKSGARAEVRDKRRTHPVELLLGAGIASGTCTCALFFDQGPCRHLWAMLIEAARRGKLHAGQEPIERFIDFLADVDANVDVDEHVDSDDEDEDLDDDDADGVDDDDADDADHDVDYDVNDDMDDDMDDDADDDRDHDADDDRDHDAQDRSSTALVRSNPRASRHGLDWREALRRQDAHAWPSPAHAPVRSLRDVRLAWILDRAESATKGALILRAMVQRTGADGRPARPVGLHVTRRTLAELPDEEDRLLMGALAGALSGSEHSVGFSETLELPTTWRIASDAQAFIIERLVRAGRLLAEEPSSGREPEFVSWLSEPPARVVLEAMPQVSGFTVEARLLRGDEAIPDRDIVFAVPGWALLEPCILAPIVPPRAANWIERQRENGPIHVRARDEAAALSTLLGRDDVPELLLPPEMGWETHSSAPLPVFDFVPAGKARTFGGALSFDYDGIVVADDDATSSGWPRRFVAPVTRRIVERDVAAENAARARLPAIGLTHVPGAADDETWQVPMKRMAAAAAALVREGWRVTASGKTYCAPAVPRIHVKSGIDWFDVEGDVSYGSYIVPLPEILLAARRGDDAVVLGDGTLGMLPTEWIRRHGRLLALGEIEDDHVRFKPTQAMLLDLLLEQLPHADCDATFARMRKRLRTFDGIEPARQPRGFVGSLRDYQLEGLAWLEYLRDFSFGGCLADDMGVGKTAQVLAMLEGRRTSRAREPRLPSLVVVPRSLIFNWLEEARRFTPRLRVADLSQSDRDWAQLEKADVGLITYGTLRRDAERLGTIALDYAILDEAQAIKNSRSASAKAARLLQARHRLVMTGTPVENHLGELWSLFEFLNPGMLGASRAFRRAPNGLEVADETLQTLSRALRPFLLRRTKAQVAKELPERTEQTLHCQMGDTQARHYRAAADRFRAELLKLIDAQGMGKSGINVLEALLRLRQLACHLALVDRTLIGEKSGKLTTLLETLGQVLEEGHKALVFSQFTSFLSIVRGELDARGIVHEDLDGSTTDRQARVRRFQSDPDCRVFLISLKAGGVGLNLTAADYVFLLDPWWNPAVEAQAIDRTHRIGQTRHVMAYRLISTGTVEERVLELQARKRALADALLGGDASLLGKLTREDIEMLLS